MSQDADNKGFAATGKNQDRFVNQRRTVRYIRKDIVARVCKGYGVGAIRLNWLRKEIPVELLDVSNRGCLIVSAEKLAVEAKVLVLLKFGTGKVFEIKAVVVRKSEDRELEYGIKFAEYNDELGDYMLKTQTELIFK